MSNFTKTKIITDTTRMTGIARLFSKTARYGCHATLYTGTPAKEFAGGGYFSDKVSWNKLWENLGLEKPSDLPAGYRAIYISANQSALQLKEIYRANKSTEVTIEIFEGEAMGNNFLIITLPTTKYFLLTTETHKRGSGAYIHQAPKRYGIRK